MQSTVLILSIVFAIGFTALILYGWRRICLKMEKNSAYAGQGQVESQPAVEHVPVELEPTEQGIITANKDHPRWKVKSGKTGEENTKHRDTPVIPTAPDLTDLPPSFYGNRYSIYNDYATPSYEEVMTNTCLFPVAVTANVHSSY